MERIGEGLGVNKATVSRDLEDSVVADCNNSSRPSKRGRMNEGRPKGKREAAPKPHAKASEIVEAHDEGKTN